MTRMNMIRGLVAGLAMVCVACSDRSGTATPATGDAHSHQHTAPHGGSLIELGDHAASLELVFDSAAGTIDLYVLDAHAENYVRIAAPSIAIQAKVADTSELIEAELLAVASPLTGEAAGDTARFSARVPQLQGRPELDVVIPQVEIAGMKFTDITAKVQPQPQ